MAFPGGGRGHAAGHFLLCADLKTGKHLWEMPITADAISAAVVEGERVYANCFDGTSFAFALDDGKELWRKQNQATSAPVLAGGQIVQTVKESRGGRIYEGFKHVDQAKGIAGETLALAATPAAYLRPNAGGGSDINGNVAAKLDASVGFGAAPQAAQLEKANELAGVSTVANAWAYQGSRAAVAGDRVMNAQAAFLNCLDASGKLAWRGEARVNGQRAKGQVFSPPSLGARDLYLTGAAGHVGAFAQSDGALRFLYVVDHPIAFQPALDSGRLYFGTSDGLVVCLEVGEDAQGWTAWGGNAQHNGRH
jgi:outer membrane protein assembly factor BamB